MPYVFRNISKSPPPCNLFTRRNPEAGAQPDGKLAPGYGTMGQSDDQGKDALVFEPGAAVPQIQGSFSDEGGGAIAIIGNPAEVFPRQGSRGRPWAAGQGSHLVQITPEASRRGGLKQIPPALQVRSRRQADPGHFYGPGGFDRPGIAHAQGLIAIDLAGVPMLSSGALME